MYLEDIPLGTTAELGSYTFTEEDIIAFATKYDPQPFHIDPVAAKAHEFGGIVASGLHVGCIWMKLMIASRDRTTHEVATHSEDPPPRAGGASPGFLDMRWKKPVRPGDTITFFNTTLAHKDLGRRKDLGILQSKSVGINQNGEEVFSYVGQGLFPRRPQAGQE
ncbi:MAG: MaoC family dehydratase [Alphaproteobacteria bacterium]|nr:MAG: MaoC family dehydratase [Alphaproteobacteria bacterium]